MGELCLWLQSGDRFEQMNKIVEEEFFIDSVMVRGAELREYFFFEVFTAFCVSFV